MTRPPRVSAEQIVAAAAAEFAERGFAGARVDRIARRAGVNKAMLYYHFKSKQALYRAMLRRLFSEAAARIGAIAASPMPAAAKVDRVIAGMADIIGTHASLPAIMLREIAEGGRHLDRNTLTILASIPRTVGGIVREGIADGSFRPVHPVFAYFSMLGPLVLFLAGAPIRREITELRLVDLRELSTEAFVKELQEAIRRTLANDRTAAGKRR